MNVNLQLSTPYADPIPSNSPPVEPQMPSGTYIKNMLGTSKPSKISMCGIAIISMLHGYSRQCHMIGSYSATAGLLVSVAQTALVTAMLPQKDWVGE